MYNNFDCRNNCGNAFPYDMNFNTNNFDHNSFNGFDFDSNFNNHNWDNEFNYDNRWDNDWNDRCDQWERQRDCICRKNNNCWQRRCDYRHQQNTCNRNCCLGLLGCFFRCFRRF